MATTVILVEPFFSCCLYPKKFQFSSKEFVNFEAGFFYGKSVQRKRINSIEFRLFNDYEIEDIRNSLEICPSDLNLLKPKFQSKRSSYRKKKQFFAEVLKWSSSLFGVLGGFILALNLSVSAYGFILLALSSFQLLVSSCIKQDKSLIVYAGSIFICVDLLGIYRWIVT